MDYPASHKMLYHRIKWSLYLMQLTLLLSSPQPCKTVSLVPVDYLIPPPTPTALRLTRLEDRTSNSQNSKTLAVPWRRRQSSGIINRAARWYGYGNNGQNQWPDSLSSANTNKQTFVNYDKHQNQEATNKKNCNLCNKYPWMPMFHNSNEWTPQALTSPPPLPAPRLPANAIAEPHHASSKIKQRAVQYQGPQINLLNVPNEYKGANRPPSAPYAPAFESHSLVTEQDPFKPSDDASFEIIKSKELVQYLASVEYPASVVQSQAIDVNVSAHITLPSNHKSEPTSNEDFQASNYQHKTFNLDLSPHIPASQIISKPGNFVNNVIIPTEEQEAIKNQQKRHPSQIFPNHENFTSPFHYLPQFPLPINSYEGDNLSAASSQNDSTVESSPPPATTTTEKVWITKANDYHYTTIVSQLNADLDVKSNWGLDGLIERGSKEYRKNRLKNFLASLQTQGPPLRKNRHRETPKNLLSAPIQHMSEGLTFDVPRPFTKDPAELGFRNKMKGHTTTQQSYFLPNHGDDGKIVPQRLLSQVTLSHPSPTPTSTYGAVDASGYYAGISPPPPPSSPTTSFTTVDSQGFKHILPFETKNQPRPFEMHKNSPFNVELLPEESMLIDVKSHRTQHGDILSKTKPNTKYLTKILANNLRELLKREHERPSDTLTNAISFDLIKLQKKIDDWIEQEYNSPLHRASTPTIRGRSKHIPIEYVEMLAATTMKTLKRQAKTAKGFDKSSDSLSISVNSLEPLVTGTEVEKFPYKAVGGNHPHELSNEINDNTTQANSTKSKAGTFLYVTIKEPEEELWKKASVTVSPRTKERLYVITPQPTILMQHSDAPLKMLKNAFKSPRFSLRPTSRQAFNNITKILDLDNDIIIDSSTEASQVHRTPDWFDLKGLTTYVPQQPVEIIDGNSKVIMIVTPAGEEETATTSANIMDLTKTKRTTDKPTTSTSPTPR